MRATISMMLCAVMALGVPATLRAESSQRVGVAELSPQAEAAIDRALEWLANNQLPNGGYGGRHAAGITGLAIMAFMVKGHMPGHGRYGQTLDKAVAFLIARAQAGGGYFGGNMYEHALATLAMSEVWGMTERPETRDTLKRAVEIILRAQHSSGGWRYQPVPLEHDISVTVMQVVALASAQEAGIMVPAQTIDLAMAYIRQCQRSDGGFSYQNRGGESAFPRSAAGVLGLMLGGQRDSDEARKGMAYILRTGKERVDKQDNHYFYGQYYAVQAAYQSGDEVYQQWYPLIHDFLVRRQRGDGTWPGEVSSAYTTAMGVLILGVPYRYLPIYQR